MSILIYKSLHSHYFPMYVLLTDSLKSFITVTWWPLSNIDCSLSTHYPWCIFTVGFVFILDLFCVLYFFLCLFPYLDCCFWCSIQYLDCCFWCVDCSIWYLDCSIQYLDCCFWCVDCSIWYLECCWPHCYEFKLALDVVSSIVWPYFWSMRTYLYLQYLLWYLPMMNSELSSMICQYLKLRYQKGQYLS